uniref:uncharacterized protein LOC122595259 n=1 Tax=Erigeron canadensis TaxID=72917 RepID=UPI001CB9CB52|nr:uncharacterized protein LOC122595259 [Erigeron canadensis]
MIKLSACFCNAARDFQKHTDLMKLMQFLMGLDDCYMSVRSNLLTRDPLPSVKTAFSVVSREESHRGGINDKSSIGNASTFVARSGYNSNSQKFSKNNSSFDSQKTFDNNFESKKTFDSGSRNLRPPNPNLKCTNCHKIGHTIERCFKLGYKFGGKFNSNNANAVVKSNVSGNVSSASTSSSSAHTLTFDHICKLLSLLDNQGSSSGLSANMAGIPMCSNTWFNFNAFMFNAFIKWIVDSGANQHMTMSAKNLTNVVDVSDLNLKIVHPNDTCVTVRQIGNLHLKNGFILFDVLIVLEYSVNLMSDLPQKNLLGTGSEQGGLYVYDDNVVCSYVVCNSARLPCESKLLWRQRLGHPADQALSVFKNKFNYGSDIIGPCEVCHKAKQTREPFPLSEHKTLKLGDLIPLDVWDPYKIASKEGFKYFLTVVDDFTRAVWTFMMKSKMEVFEIVKSFPILLNTQFNAHVKIIRSDNDTEFVNNQIKTSNSFKEFVLPYDEEEDMQPDHVSGSGPHNSFGSSSKYTTSGTSISDSSSGLPINENVPSSSFTSSTRIGDESATLTKNDINRNSEGNEDFELDGKVKYRLNKVVNYANLSSGLYAFVSNLNKTIEPKNYFEAATNPKWVEAMNLEMEALNRNET